MTRFYSSLLLSTTLVTACASTDVGNPISTEIEFAGYQGLDHSPMHWFSTMGLRLKKPLSRSARSSWTEVRLVTM